MGKRIIVGLDPSEHSKAAVGVACERAKLYDGTVVGVAIIDRPGIEHVAGSSPVGAGLHAKQTTEFHLEQADQTCDRLLDELESTCKKAGVRYERVKSEGKPVEMLVEQSLSADLVVVGTRTFFGHETRDDPGDTLQRLLKARVCPVLAVPEEPPEIERVIFACDGSGNAARAMRMITYQTPQSHTQIPVTLLHLGNEEKGRHMLEAPAKYLRAHGRNVDIRVEEGTPKRVVLDVVRELQPAMVVVGVSSKGTLGELVFGSVTKSLLEDGTILIFIAP